MSGSITKHPLRFVVCDLGPAVAALCCPVCGCDRVHLAEVIVEQGKTKTVVGRELTRVLATDHGATHRGSFIVVRFFCEEGHDFQYQFAFSHGTTSCELHAGQHDGSDELWRD